MSLLSGSEILTSRPSTVRWPLDMLAPATAVYSPASDRRTDGKTRRCINFSELILYLRKKQTVKRKLITRLTRQSKRFLRVAVDVCTCRTSPAPDRPSSTSPGCSALRLHIQRWLSSSPWCEGLSAAWWIQSHGLQGNRGRSCAFHSLQTFFTPDCAIDAHLTLHMKLGRSDCRPCFEGVLSAISKMNVPDVQSVAELFAASLASVRGFDFHAVLQPFVRYSLIVDVHLKRDNVLLLGIEVFQHSCDQNSCKTKVSSPWLSLPFNCPSRTNKFMLKFYLNDQFFV